MQAKGKYILIEKITPPNRTIGGLELTESQDKENRFLFGKVISMGELVSNHGYLKIGDKIYYNKHAGHTISLDGKVLYVIEYADVVGVK